MQPAEQLPWELEDEILSLVPTKSLERFRCVCKRWNSLFNDRRILNNDLGLTRPQFILLTESKICSVDVNLDRLSIEVHNLPSDIPGYELSMHVTIEYCDGLLIYFTCMGVGICNPWLRQIRWIEPGSRYHDFNGMGYDNTRPDKHYKIFESYNHNNTTVISSIFETESDAWRSNKCSTEDWYFISYYSVSLNGTLYWVALNLKSLEYFIQSFDFSVERFEPYCILPNKSNSVRDARSLAVFRIDRFSYLEQSYHTRNIEIWVTENKIKNRDGKDVKWLSFMNVLVPQWSSLQVTYRRNRPPSYFIDDKSLSLVLCCLNKEHKGYIYIANAKGDKFHELKINDLVDDYPRHRTYFPSLVPVPRFTSSTSKIQHVGARYTLPRGVEVSNGVGGNEWDDGFFDNVKKINVGINAFGTVFVKFDYSKNNAIVAGAGHGNASAYIPENGFWIADDDYIEAVEGTYTESQITSIMFRMHNKNRRTFGGPFNGIPFVLGGGRGSKIIGFYGKSSHLHLTAFGVHLSPSV